MSTNADAYERELYQQRMTYRTALTSTEQKLQEDLDKMIVSLSGGALGVSFIFLKDIVGGRPIAAHWLLMAAWGLWAASIASVLLSYYVGSALYRKSIDQVDDGTIHLVNEPGGWLNKAALVLNILSGSLFVLGVVAMMLFVSRNLV